MNEPLKLELIRDLPEDTVLSIYDQGNSRISVEAHISPQLAWSRLLSC